MAEHFVECSVMSAICSENGQWPMASCYFYIALFMSMDALLHVHVLLL